MHYIQPFQYQTPGFLVLTMSGMFLYSFVDPSNPPIWLLGIPPAAVSLIFKAFYGFGLNLDKLGLGLAMFSCIVATMINGDEHIPRDSSQIVYPALLFLGGCFTVIDFCRGEGKSLGNYVRATGSSEPTVRSLRHCLYFMYILFVVHESSCKMPKAESYCLTHEP